MCVLYRKRMIEQLNAQRKINDEERRKTEESLARQEVILSIVYCMC
jgi:hypothetical protein